MTNAGSGVALNILLFTTFGRETLETIVPAMNVGSSVKIPWLVIQRVSDVGGVSQTVRQPIRLSDITFRATYASFSGTQYETVYTFEWEQGDEELDALVYRADIARSTRRTCNTCVASTSCWGLRSTVKTASDKPAPPVNVKRKRLYWREREANAAWEMYQKKHQFSRIV
jgi:hypothetical protein